ncbi:hypothetical protein BGX30_008525, partial [Mortierella sp. GBA39]
SSKNLEEESTDYRKMVRILSRTQEVLTNAVDELACLGRKTTLLMAQNRFTLPGQKSHEPEQKEGREGISMQGSWVQMEFKRPLTRNTPYGPCSLTRSMTPQDHSVYLTIGVPVVPTL